MICVDAQGIPLAIDTESATPSLNSCLLMARFWTQAVDRDVTPNCSFIVVTGVGRSKLRNNTELLSRVRMTSFLGPTHQSWLGKQRLWPCEVVTVSETRPDSSFFDSAKKPPFFDPRTRTLISLIFPYDFRRSLSVR